MGFDALSSLDVPCNPSRLELDGEQGLVPNPGLECKDAEAWVCAICCENLGTSWNEIGALTCQGERIEKALYHSGCISMMLIHGLRQGHGHWEPNMSSYSKPIICAQSPVTRKAVDGCSPMPPFTEYKKWTQFMDWRCCGELCVMDIIAVSAPLLPAAPDDIESFVRKRFNLVGADLETSFIPAEDVELVLLPFLEELASTVTTANAVQPPTPLWTHAHVNFGPNWGRCAAAPQTSSVRHKEALIYLCSLSKSKLSRCFWCVCKTWNRVARRLIVQESCYCLEEASEVSRVVACLAVIVDSPDTCARQVSLRLLKDPCSDVRKHALSLLVRSSRRRDTALFNKISSALKDDAPRVREAAISLLPYIAEDDAEGAVQMLIACLQEPDLNVRRSVDESLSCICQKGNEYAISTLLLIIEGTDLGLAAQALKTLPRIVQRGHKACVTAVSRLLNNADLSVRRAALLSIGQLADIGDRKVLRALVSSMSDEDQWAREAALKSAVSVAQPGDKELIQGVLSLRKHSETYMRVLTLQTLQEVVPKGNKHVIGVVVEMMKDSDSHVRSTAAAALGILANLHDPKAVNALNDLLKGNNGFVREIYPVVRRAAEYSVQCLDPGSCVENRTIEGECLENKSTKRKERTTSGVCCGFLVLKPPRKSPGQHQERIKGWHYGLRGFRSSKNR